MRVVGYIRVSTEEQATSGLGLEAQRAAILGECGRRGWQLVEMVADEGGQRKVDDKPARPWACI